MELWLQLLISFAAVHKTGHDDATFPPLPHRGEVTTISNGSKQAAKQVLHEDSEF